MGGWPSKGDKKITSALTYEGTDRSHEKGTGQDCKAGGWAAGNDPFGETKVWSQTSPSLPITVQTITTIVIATIWLGAHPGMGPGVFSA